MSDTIQPSDIHSPPWQPGTRLLIGRPGRALRAARPLPAAQPGGEFHHRLAHRLHASPTGHKDRCQDRHAARTRRGAGHACLRPPGAGRNHGTRLHLFSTDRQPGAVPGQHRRAATGPNREPGQSKSSARTLDARFLHDQPRADPEQPCFIPQPTVIPGRDRARKRRPGCGFSRNRLLAGHGHRLLLVNGLQLDPADASRPGAGGVPQGCELPSGGDEPHLACVPARPGVPGSCDRRDRLHRHAHRRDWTSRLSWD